MIGVLFLIITCAVFVGLVFLYRGLRGYPALTDPSCMKCGYDLRGFTGDRPTTCSECGADLTARWAIRLATYRKDTRITWIGAGLLLAAVVAVPLMRYLTIVVGPLGGSANSPMVIQAETNTQIIANLKTTANSPWAWQELERRLTAGKLSQSETAAAVDQYILYRTTAGGNRVAGPMSWCENFFTQADAAHFISAEQFDRLVDAFFGPPTVKIATAVGVGPTPATIAYGGPWDLMGRSSIYALQSIKLEDGTAVVCVLRGNDPKRRIDLDTLSSSGPFEIDADLYIKTKPGPHQLTFIIDTGVVDRDTKQLINSSRPGQAKQWPSNIVHRPRQVTVPITVLATGAPTLELITDTAHRQWPPLGIQSVTAIPAASGTRIKVMLTSLPSDVDFAYDISLTVDGHTSKLGQEDRCGNTGSSSDLTVTIQPPLSPEITAATVTCTPNADRAAHTPGVNRIWNVPLEFKDVPLRRLDILTPTTQKEPG